jgi:superfamily II DNA/RNA helicase
MSYSLTKFREIMFNGFDFVIPNDNVELINLLASQVGSQTYVKTPVFKKRDPSDGVIFGASSNQSNFKLGGGNRKKKGNRNMEINDDDWESLRTFQATKIEQKNGMDSQIDLIRLLLNKLTDKTFLEIRGNIIAKLDEIISSSDFTEEVSSKISNVIYDISANNKFFSKIYADLYAEILNKLVDLVRGEVSKSVIFFATSLEQSRLIASLLYFLGIHACHIDGSTPSLLRQELITKFRTQKINVLCNYEVLATGFVAPLVDCVFIARPTASVVLYSQMIGRGLRGPAVGGKSKCLIVNVRDNFSNLPSINTMYKIFDDYWTGVD